MEKVNAKKIGLKITLKHEGLNADVNTCVESRHVPHGRVLCFVWVLDIYIANSKRFHPGLPENRNIDS